MYMSPYSPKIPIFVSSTFKDMEPFRDKVRLVLNQYNVDIRGMELFGARTQKPLETCLDEVKSSELFIGIIGMRYGSMDKESGKSFVELEYETAVASHLGIKIYIIDEEKARISPINVECENVEKLKEFKQKLKTEHTCVIFESELDLSEKVKGDLEKFFIKRVGEPTRSRAFVSGTVSSATIAKGDDFYIAGTATETQFLGVAIWIFGQNFFNYYIVDVMPDDSYTLQLPSAMTRQMQTGQFFVVIQHPMTNNRFDVIPVISRNSIVVKNSFNKEKFVVQGPDSITGADAAMSVVEFINKTTIDDTYTKLQFLIADPVIQIDTIQPKKSGDKFSITGITNLAIDNEIFVQVMPRMIHPSPKMHFGVTGITKITRGDSGVNRFSFDVDLIAAETGEYLINIIWYKIGLVATQVFTVE